MTVAPESCEIVDLVREPGEAPVLMLMVGGSLRRFRLRVTQVANLGAKCATVTADHVAESVRRARGDGEGP